MGLKRRSSTRMLPSEALAFQRSEVACDRREEAWGKRMFLRDQAVEGDAATLRIYIRSVETAKRKFSDTTRGTELWLSQTKSIATPA
jgi:hypothetical protein